MCSRLVLITLIAGAVASSSCRRDEPQRAPFVPLQRIESTYGRLIAVGNHPTADQNGTGERIGLFRAADGTVWGLPLGLDEQGAVVACAAPGLDQAPATDTLPPGTAELLGATNEPTGWRGGTGQLELVVRDVSGVVRRHSVRSREMPGSPACWAQEPPGPRQRLHYYRLMAVGHAAPIHARLETIQRRAEKITSSSGRSLPVP
jgi:hypothetical protein